MKQPTTEVLASAFRAKINQAMPLLNRPLLLLKNKWENPNFRMFLLDTEFSRPTALIIMPSGNVALVAHSMEVQAVEPLVKDLELLAYSKGDEFSKLIEGFLRKGSAVEIEHSSTVAGLDLVSHSMYKQFKQYYDLQSAEGVLLPLRSVKTSMEVDFIREAAQNTYAILGEVEKLVKPGTTEREINRCISHLAVDYDMPLSFSPIVAAGPRATDPHPVRYTDRPLEKGDRIIVDMGLWCHGYASDITRTYIVDGKPEDTPWYGVNQKILETLTTVKMSDHTPLTLAKTLQEIVNQAGMLPLEKHSYGHGLGVEVHDLHPLIAVTESALSGINLQEGLVFTMEPGFYNESGGFRIEDDYLIENDRAVLIK